MKKVIIGILFLKFSAILEASAITYVVGKERLGDHLIAYSHARWGSYKHKCPFVYKAFPHSSKLALDQIHTLKDADIKKFSKVVHLTKPSDLLNIRNDQNILYVLPEFFIEVFHSKVWQTFDIDWNDPQFLNLLKSEICPKEPLNLTPIPTNCVSVAVHIRTGKGYDKLLFAQRTGPYADVVSPLRFPPNDYYVTCIKKISDLLKNTPLYVHIFTDDPNPDVLVKQIKEQVNNDVIRFGFRKEGNHHSKNVLEDFFSMLKFDCLIRPQSNYSFLVSKLGDFKIVISPLNYERKQGKLIIKDVVIDQKQGA